MTETAKAQAAPGAGHPGRERRVWVRYLCNLPTQCQPVMSKSDACWTGQIQNISRGGINLAVSRRFEPGTLLHIELQAAPGQEVRTVLARVVHATLRKPGAWSLGCAFPWELGEDDLRALLVASDTTIE